MTEIYNADNKLSTCENNTGLNKVSKNFEVDVKNICCNESANEKTLLKIKNLQVRFSNTIILDDINLELKEGEFLGLIGPNGAGKTTLLRAILGAIKISKGEVNKTKISKKNTIDIGYVPQRHEFEWDYPISVEDVVVSGRFAKLGYFKRPGLHDYKQALFALKLVGMEKFAKRPIGQLSGGQKQRVLVARALSINPKVLILDEPFNGLDMPTQDLLINLFTKLSQEKKAVIMTTHDLNGALATCSRICLINSKILADSNENDIMDKKLWQDTFKVDASSPMLRSLGVK